MITEVMIPHGPNFVVTSCCPFAQRASTAEKLLVIRNVHLTEEN